MPLEFNVQRVIDELMYDGLREYENLKEEQRMQGTELGRPSRGFCVMIVTPLSSYVDGDLKLLPVPGEGYSEEG
jgi:hypothetical protein